MKIHRRGKSAYEWSETDCKGPEDIAKLWISKNIIPLDGTIDKGGERHTEIGLELEDDDVISLFYALIEKYRNEIANLNVELEEAINNADEKEGALDKIYDLITYHSEDAPTLDSLLGAVQTIADHFRGHKVVGIKPKLKWIQYEKIHGHYKDGRFYEGKEFL